MSKKRVLLLNPSNEKGEMIIKDQYCSFTSKADYFWVPIDLLVLSGDLAQKFDLKVVDSTAQQLSTKQTLEKVREFQPDHIVILSSILTHEFDRSLIREIKKSNPSLKTTFIGDVFYFSPNKMICFDEVDSIIYEYPCPELADYISHGEASCNIIYKSESRIVTTPKRVDSNIVYSRPRHDLFELSQYSVPFMMEDKCTSVLTNFGCKYTCNYCPASSVAYRQRPVEEIISELRFLKSQGISNIWIRDFTFGLHKKLTKELLPKMRDLDISWFCLSRAETLDREMIEGMSEAGCYLIMIGVDSISADTMKKIARKQSDELLRDRIAHAGKQDIQVLVHMILGFPGDRVSDMLRTIHFLAGTKANFLSINFFSPRAGSDYFKEESIKNLEAQKLDSNYAKFQEEEKNLTIVLLKYYALLIFYCNPIRVLRILLGMKSKRQFQLIMRTGLKQFFPKLKTINNED